MPVTDPRIRYETFEFGAVDIHVRGLRDRQEFSDDDGVAARLGIGSADWAFFGVVWESGRALARLTSDFPIEGRSVLEVGCGIGLASLMLNKRLVNITATDHHPDGEAFLQCNCALNGGPPVPFVRCGWTDSKTVLPRFDLIIGSDLLYQRGHAADLSKFVDLHAHAKSEVVIVDPGRGECARFSRHMAYSGFRAASLPLRPSDAAAGFTGRYLHYLR